MLARRPIPMRSLLLLLALLAAPLAAQRPDRALEDFRALIEAADLHYLGGKRRKARPLYDRALETAKRLRPEPGALVALQRLIHRDASTEPWLRLYDDAGGPARRRLARALLPLKRDLCTGPARDEKAVHLRIAVLVIRHKDLLLEGRNGRERRVGALTATDLRRYRAALDFAFDAIRHFARGRLVLDARWIETGATAVRRIERLVRDGRVHVVPDLATLSPRQDTLFRRLHRDHSGVVVVWPRAASDTGHGAGPLRLPVHRKTLAARHGIRSLPQDPLAIIHAFLLNLQGPTLLPPPPRAASRAWDLLRESRQARDELTWLDRRLSAVKRWDRARLR